MEQHLGRWVIAFGQGVAVCQMHFTVMVKGMRHTSLDCKDMEKAQTDILCQNTRLEGQVEILGMGFSCTQCGRVAGPLFIDLTSPHQANLLLQEGLVLGSLFHEGEVYHQDCQVTRCFVCHTLGHSAKVCQQGQHCSYCAKNRHSNDKCEVKATKHTPQCVNCRGAHPAWSTSCPVWWEASTHTQRAFETQPVAFTVPQAQESGWEMVGHHKHHSTAGEGNDR